MSPKPSGDASDSRTATLLLGALLLAQLVLHWPLLNDHPYGARTWRMADTAAMAPPFVDDHSDRLHPRIDWDRGESGHVQTELPLYTWAVAFLWAMGSEHPRTAELLSLVLGLLALFCFFGFARHVLGERRALFATAWLAFTPLVFYFSGSMQAESLLLLASYGALWAWVSHLRSGRPGRLAAWALAISVVLGIKPQNVLLPVPMLMLARGATGPGGGSWRGPALAFAAALVIPALWFWHGHPICLQTHNSFGIMTSGGADKFSIGLHLRTPRWWVNVGRDLVPSSCWSRRSRSASGVWRAAGASATIATSSPGPPWCWFPSACWPRP